MTLVKFDQSHKYLDRIGIPRLKAYNNNVVISKIDLTEQDRKGNIEWRNNGVYLNINGKFYRGFMYIKHPDINRYGLPKFHILECKTISDQKKYKKFHDSYFWSNSPTVTVFDRSTGEEIKNQTLSLCGNCIQKLEEDTSRLSNTKDFHETLNINDKKITSNHQNIATDISGRPLEWQEISKAYRREQNYTCENCGFGPHHMFSSLHKRFIHTHHINGYELTNTHRSNLKALCILCHAHQDEHHKSNFEKPSSKRELEHFLSKYSKTLTELGNPYIKPH